MRLLASGTCLFFLMFSFARASVPEMIILNILEAGIKDAQRTVFRAPQFPEKRDLLRDLNNLYKYFAQPAEGIKDALKILEDISQMTPFEQGAAIQKAANETVQAYKKRVAESDKMKANIDKTPYTDPAYPSKVKKLEEAHEDLARLQATSGVLDDARRNGIQSATAAADARANRLAAQGADELAELQRRSEFARLKPVSPVRPPSTPRSDAGSMRRANLFPPDDGFFPSDDTVMRRMRPSMPVVSPAPSSPSFFSRALGVGAKGLKVLPLVGELWTRKENALMTSAHALTEACIRNESNAGETALYVGMQYVYRGVGFLSLVPNLADSATPESIQSTLNFLLNAGCFDEYREFVNSNTGLFKDLGLDNLQIASPADISKKEKQYADLQKRLNTPLTDEEIAADRRAANAALAQDLADKRNAFAACCGLLVTNACPLSAITNDLVKNAPALPASSDKPLFPIPKDDTVPVMTCSGLQADIKDLENRLIVR